MTTDTNPSEDPQTPPNAEPQSESNPENSSPPVPAAKKIAIGSQRDAAGAVPAKPKAVQAAIANPLEIGETAEVDPVSLEEIKSNTGFSDDLDAEIDAMINNFSMDDVVQATQATEAELEPKTRMEGTVAKIHGENVFFALAGQYEGIASLAHFKEHPSEGDKLEVIVRGLNKEDGLYELSIPGSAVSVSDWDDINEGDVVEAVVTGSNSGGLEAKINTLPAFIPASQIDRFRVEDFEQYVGKKMQCVIMESNPDKRKLVISHRAVLDRENEAKRQALLETIEEGQLHEGVVTKLMDFGAFVDIGGMEGLIHISKLAWTRLKHPSEAVSEGQTVKVKIDKFDKETGKLSLSHRDTLDHPWENIHEQFQPNDIVKGRVTKVAQFGAFVQLALGVEGLVHISEIDHKRVVAVKNYVSEGDQVTVKILSIDKASNKMSLSMKACHEAPVKAADVKKEEEEDIPVREQIVPKHEGPLKGGTGKSAGGEQFGLKW